LSINAPYLVILLVRQPYEQFSFLILPPDEVTRIWLNAVVWSLWIQSLQGAPII